MSPCFSPGIGCQTRFRHVTLRNVGDAIPTLPW
uniref:Uncharacterized protein n=1 Tax=Anguilla anguilla TaxID=7936 RepID=A0A0E9PYB2_ANGAN